MPRRHRPILAFRRASLSSPTLPAVTPKSLSDAGAIMLAVVRSAIAEKGGGPLPRPAVERCLKLSMDILRIADTDPALFMLVEVFVKMTTAARASGEGA